VERLEAGRRELKKVEEGGREWYSVNGGGREWRKRGRAQLNGGG
jgi:hypothetical protein